MATNAQVVGIVAFTLLILVKLYILSNPKAWAKSGRVAALWTVVYFLFLYVVRGLSLLNLGTRDELRIVSGYATVLPLLGVLVHLFLFRNAPSSADVSASIDEAKQLVKEAKELRAEAVEAVIAAKSGKQK